MLTSRLELLLRAYTELIEKRCTIDTMSKVADVQKEIEFIKKLIGKEVEDGH